MAERRKLLHKQDAAKLLGISRVTMWKWTRRGLIPVVRVNGREWIDSKDVERFIERNKQGGQHAG